MDILNELAYTILRNDPEETIKYGIMARDMAELLGYTNGLAYALKNIGLGYYYQGDYLPGLDYWNQSLEAFETSEDSTGIANILNNLGAVYLTMGSNTKAVELFLRSLRISEKLNDTVRIATALVNIGGHYSDNEKDYSKAIQYFWQYGKIANLFPVDDFSRGAYLTGIAEVHMNLENYDSAMYYLEKSLPIYENTAYMAEVLIRLGMVQEAMGDFDSAIEYQKDAYQTAVESEQSLSITRSLLNLGNIYLNKGNLADAHAAYQQAEEQALEHSLNYELRDIYQGQALTYAQQRFFDEAYQYQIKYQAIKDTLFNLEADDKVRGLQFTYEIDKKQDEINLLEKDAEIAQLENRRQKAISRASGIVGVLLLILAIGLYQRFKFVRKTKRIIEYEKNRSENLLLNILPEETAEELKENGAAKARSYDMVSILFTDFKGFTSIASKMSAEELVREIHEHYKVFDEIMDHYNIEKIKTIGDAYMAAGGLPVPNDTHALDVIRAAIEIREYMLKLQARKSMAGKPYFEIRIGIHTGPVVAGIVGTKKFAYDIWGDTVNIAARMESNSEPGKINISQSTYELVKDQALCSYRGEIEAKNRGMLKMYFVENLKMTQDHSVHDPETEQTIN